MQDARLEEEDMKGKHATENQEGTTKRNGQWARGRMQCAIFMGSFDQQHHLPMLMASLFFLSLVANIVPAILLFLFSIPCMPLPFFLFFCYCLLLVVRGVHVSSFLLHHDRSSSNAVAVAMDQQATNTIVHSCLWKKE